MTASLDESNPDGDVDYLIDSHYYSCYVYAANRALSYLELVDNTIFEAN